MKKMYRFLPAAVAVAVFVVEAAPRFTRALGA